ncbi:MAG: DUF349 domain-containing protein [Bifidobacteriaceae bacterium]|nr:DUF349 domain-containing protein [Bifidobacteriaceae bacterium]
MSEQTVTTSDNESATPKPATPKPAAPKPGPHPSPAAFAKKAAKATVKPVSTTFSDEDVREAEKFGRVGDDGTVYVKDGDDERAVGQYPDAEKEKALKPFAKRYLELKAKLDGFAARLASPSIKPGEIGKTLQQLQSEVAEPQVVGDLDALRKQFGELKVTGEQRKAELEKQRKEAYAKALDERTKIVEKAEAIVAGLDDDTTNWRDTGDKLQKVFEEWQHHQKTTMRLNKSDADALWKRFSAARSTFAARRRKWSQARDTQRAEAKAAKEQIIKEAEEIKDSTDWGETSHKFNELMDRWKRSGHTGRQEDDALWARFRAAADTFFNARQADRDKMNEGEKENLAKKEELLKQAQALVPVKSAKEAKQARQALSKIQEQWDQIGFVPRSDVHRIESALDDVDRQIKAVEDAEWKQTDPETEARKSDFERQLEDQLAELDKKIAAETDPKKKADLEAEKATKEKWLSVVK